MSKRNISMHDKLTPVGRAIRSTYAGRFYHDGDGAGFVWNWWHPIAWIGAPLGFLAHIALEGFPAAWRDRHSVGLRMNPWFLDHPDHLEWDAPLSRPQSTPRVED